MNNKQGWIVTCAVYAAVAAVVAYSFKTDAPAKTGEYRQKGTRLKPLSAASPNIGGHIVKSVAPNFSVSLSALPSAQGSRDTSGRLSDGRTPAKKKLTVYGNGDGYLGKRTADGTKYTKDAWWFAYNNAPLGSELEVVCHYTCKKGHKNVNKVNGPVKDRMASDNNIDSTLRTWKALTWCSVCKQMKAYGREIVSVRRVK